jgi:tRNA 2-thiouridine synthesizing protein A
MNELDTRGTRCPIPVMRTNKALKQLTDGELTVYADDPDAKIDIPALVATKKLKLVRVVDHGMYQEYVIAR